MAQVFDYIGNWKWKIVNRMAEDGIAEYHLSSLDGHRRVAYIVSGPNADEISLYYNDKYAGKLGVEDLVPMTDCFGLTLGLGDRKIKAKTIESVFNLSEELSRRYDD